MCGITGFSLTPEDAKALNGTNLMRTLLYGIESRGKHATGIAWWDPKKENVLYNKADKTATKFITSGQNIVHEDAPVAIAHTRHATQGRPENNWNNHPIMINTVIGVHNGMIDNDYEIFRTHQNLKRQAEVDSEVIFQVLAHETTRNGLDIDDKDRIKTTITALEGLRGSMAIAWLDTNNPQSLNLAKGIGSPLIIAFTKSGSVIFASTQTAIESAERQHEFEVERFVDTPDGMWFAFDGPSLLVWEKFEPMVRYRHMTYSNWEDDYFGYATHRHVDARASKPALVSGASNVIPVRPRERKPYTDPQGVCWWPVLGGGWTNVKPEEADEQTVATLREETPRPRNQMFVDVLTPDVDEVTLSCVRGQWEADRDDEQEKSDEFFHVINDTKSFELLRWYFAYEMRKHDQAMDEDVHECLYGDREDAIIRFYTDPADGDQRNSITDKLHGYARVGDEIETSVDGEMVRGHIVAMPQTYPEGDYVLSVQKGYRSRTGLKWEDQLVYRQWFGFKLLATFEKEPADAEATTGA